MGCSSGSDNPDHKVVESKAETLALTIMDHVSLYDHGGIGLQSLRNEINVLVHEAVADAYDVGFKRGLEEAELDPDDTVEGEVELDFNIDGEPLYGFEDIDEEEDTP